MVDGRLHELNDRMTGCVSRYHYVFTYKHYMRLIQPRSCYQKGCMPAHPPARLHLGKSSTRWSTGWFDPQERDICGTYAVHKTGQIGQMMCVCLLSAISKMCERALVRWEVNLIKCVIENPFLKPFDRAAVFVTV